MQVRSETEVAKRQLDAERLKNRQLQKDLEQKQGESKS